MSLAEVEFEVLRRTIATRGTTRIVLFPLTILGWAATAALLVGNPPFARLFSLAVLVAGFESIHALHVGVERIGRYLQVYYESRPEGPRWETTAMSVGPALPGGGIDPLFTLAFGGAVVLNLIPTLFSPRGVAELAVTSVVHAGFLVRLIRARAAAARQRTIELESFRALLAAAPSPRP